MGRLDIKADRSLAIPPRPLERRILIAAGEREGGVCAASAGPVKAAIAARCARSSASFWTTTPPIHFGYS